MSRIPVFIERSGRKEWNHNAETCIFIACDSLDSTIDNRSTSKCSIDTFAVDESIQSEIGQSEETVFENSIGANGINLPEHVDENRLIDKVYFNDTLEEDVHAKTLFTRSHDVADTHEGVLVKPCTCVYDYETDGAGVQNLVQHGHNPEQNGTAMSLTVVTCSKGVVKQVCKCSSSTGSERKNLLNYFDNMTAKAGVENTKTGQNDRRTGHSFIPRPTRLIVGKVTITPAPQKKLKSKSQKKTMQEDAFTNKHISGSMSVEQNKSQNRSTGKEELGHRVETVELEENEKLVRELGTQNKNASGVKTDLVDGTCTESTVYRSQHELEDSEPEYAQHAMDSQKFALQTNMCSDEPAFKHKCSQETTEFEDLKMEMKNKINSSAQVVKDSGVNSITDMKETGTIKFVKAGTPRASGIPKLQYDRYKIGDINNVELKPRFSSSPKRSSVSTINSGQMTTGSRQNAYMHSVQSSGQKSQRLDKGCIVSVQKSPKKIQNGSELPKAVGNSEADRPMYSISGNGNIKVYETKSSRLRKKVISNTFFEGQNNENTSAVPQLSAQVTTDLVPCSSRDYKAGSVCKRNLPRAPTEVRTVRYGQRCVVSVEKRKAVGDKVTHDLEESKIQCGQSNVVSGQESKPLGKHNLNESKYQCGHRNVVNAKDDECVNKMDSTDGAVTASGRLSGGKQSASASANSSIASNSSTGSGGGGKSKRPAWDLKGRLQDMEEQWRQKENEKSEFLLQMQQCNERIALLENHNSQLTGTVAQKEQNLTHTSQEIHKLQDKLRTTEDELYEVRRQFERDTENFEFTKASLRRQKEALEGEITSLQAEVTGLKSSVAQLTSSQAGLKSELECTKLALEQANKTTMDRDKRIRELEEKLEREVAMVADLNSKCREHETTRRVLHNTIQELKGNIRVFCRVRPLIGEELFGNDGQIPHMAFPDEEGRVLELDKLAEVSLSESTIGGQRKGNGGYKFTFDKVFGPSSQQKDVFDEISQLVQSALDGYNVCIFAYGQTGSGKTYTMEGPSVVNEESRGMISRAVTQIFTSTRDLEEKGWQYQFEGSFLEIYNETIRDLLGVHDPDVKHEIKLTGSGSNDVTVTNLTTVQVTGEDQITDLLKMASKNRAVGETLCNERSSRSHSVFRLKITGANEITSEQCKGTLNLVDLAGSERLKDSGATGQRLKETQNINKSLANLGNVIMALGNKESHIPYRNSKLTYLLQNSLGGNSKTLMFVNVSPREENFAETLNSLRFATKVNQCNIGTATKKIK